MRVFFGAQGIFARLQRHSHKMPPFLTVYLVKSIKSLGLVLSLLLQSLIVGTGILAMAYALNDLVLRIVVLHFEPGVNVEPVHAFPKVLNPRIKFHQRDFLELEVLPESGLLFACVDGFRQEPDVDFLGRVPKVIEDVLRVRDVVLELLSDSEDLFLVRFPGKYLLFLKFLSKINACHGLEDLPAFLVDLQFHVLYFVLKDVQSGVHLRALLLVVLKVLDDFLNARDRLDFLEGGELGIDRLDFGNVPRHQIGLLFVFLGGEKI